MSFAQEAGVPLVASRFLETTEGAFDLATAAPVTFRRLPPCEPADERRWADACSRLWQMWHEDLPPLLDHGFIPEGRFEAYGRCPSRSLSREGSAALSAFLGGAEPASNSARGPTRVGIRLVVPAAVVSLGEILEDGHPGHPVCVTCVAEPGAGATTFLGLAASLARRHGYVPLSVPALERWPDVIESIRGRSVLLLCDAGDSTRRADQWFFRLGMASTGSHVLLRVADRISRGADITLRLDPIDPNALAHRVHVYPRAGERRVREAAERSGGLPARFLACLREPDRRKPPRVLRVAEAHPAYSGENAPAEPELDHPWRDLIGTAVGMGMAGRTAAAERDLRQIAAAAERRRMTLAAGTAEVELARLLLARGRTADARELFAARAQRHVDHLHLATRAGLGLGFVHLLQGDLEAAESTFRVCRAVYPAEAAIGLGWTLLAQGRDLEAERAVVPARESADTRCRARALVLTAAIALARHDLPGAARAAAQAVTIDDEDRITGALAATLLAIVHGRIGDRDAVERHGHRALASARAARAPLLTLGVRAAFIEAVHACGAVPARKSLDRMLRATGAVPALVRAFLLAILARTHPVAQQRAELSQQLATSVRTTGARALLPAAEAAAARLASDATALVDIYECCVTPAATLTRLAEWLRERVNARAVLVCDASGAPLVRTGAQDAIAAVARVLRTRLAQPPWATPDGLEAAVIVRYANAVQGAIACRWPLSRTVTADVVSTMTAAAAIAAPAIASLAERTIASGAAPDGIVGGSAVVVRLRDQIMRAAMAPFSILIEGESGAGKELVARAIHRESPRRLRACVAINCAALSDDLFEAEVFGHARGAFTGAHAERPGLFEQADGGTLFLDEVSELSPRAQAKLLRALQEGEVRRIGENHSRRVDVRVVAASNRRLEDEAAAGRFRRDLLFRLAVIRISVPPLRERREDIPLLAAHCWESAASRAGARSLLTSAAVARLSQYDWPGNVRELQNVIAALAVQVPRGRVGAEHVAALIGATTPAGQSGQQVAGRLDEARRAFERQFIAAAIARCGGRRGAAAHQLGISRQGLAKLLRRLEP